MAVFLLRPHFVHNVKFIVKPGMSKLYISQMKEK